MFETGIKVLWNGRVCTIKGTDVKNSTTYYTLDVCGSERRVPCKTIHMQNQTEFKIIELREQKAKIDAELQAKKVALEAELIALTRERKQQAVDDIKAMMLSHKITINDLIKEMTDVEIADSYATANAKHNLTINGITKSLIEWCREYNVSYQRAYGRVRAGKSVHELFA